eukprot:3068498-Pyramimonas_sp.AAC.1
MAGLSDISGLHMMVIDTADWSGCLRSRYSRTQARRTTPREHEALRPPKHTEHPRRRPSPGCTRTSNQHEEH